MTRQEALKVVYDMAEQSLDRGSCVYKDWPEAWEALYLLMPEVYPDGDDFVISEIKDAGKEGRKTT